jgi:hypothetical protein
MRRFLTMFATLLVGTLVGVSSLQGQGVTTSVINGVVRDANGIPVAGASIMAVHEPSASRYGTFTRADGRFIIPGMRVGGPYTVTASMLGYGDQFVEGITLTLGSAVDLEFTMQQQAIQLEELTITARSGGILSSDRTGAATQVSRQQLDDLPTVSGRISDFTRLTPQFGGGFSFAGQDNRLNNITVDGAYFNNSFALGATPGDRTGVAPISLDAIEQVQVNIAPFDVRQGNFVGAGVNTVIRSGANDFRGQLRYQMRDDGLVGTKAGKNDFDPGAFDFRNIGGWLSGPILRDRLFFFVHYENEDLTEPGTNFRANTGNQTAEGNITRVLASDLDGLSNFLQTNFGYETGPYQGYDHQTPATRFVTKLDYNINDRNKLSFTYRHLNSETDVLMSNSSSLGFGSRRTNVNALNFRNSNYSILENIRSVVAEWNSIISRNMSNQVIAGYSYHDESRGFRGERFPMVDILNGGSTYTSFGFEPFTPNNELRYWSYQIQNNFTRYAGDHTLTFGLSAERFESENVFFPGSQSVYVYNSLDDFYADANDHLANPTRTTSPVNLRRFQVRWSNIPGLTKPVQPLEVLYAGLYAQDEWQVNPDLKLTLGLRVDFPKFGDTGFENQQVDGLTFRDENGNAAKYSTSKLPDTNPLFSPRIGMNWDVFGDRSTQVRGGTGIFSGRPAFVWISNQIGNNGVLTGFEALDNTTARPFHPDPDHYKPTNVTGAPAASYELAFTNPDFRFPQVWRSNLAVDQQLPWGLIGTGEFIYSRDVNGIYYINANLPAPDGNFSGPDARPRWITDKCPAVSGTQRNRLPANCMVTSAIVLKNQNVGSSWNLAASLERPFSNGLFVKAAYSYGEAKNTVNPGSIAFGSWNNNPHAGDPNNPGVGFSFASPGHRIFLAGTYKRELLPVGPTTISLFWNGYTAGNGSYAFAGDANGDGGTSNDLIYIPRDRSEMNFQTYTSGGVTFTSEQQADAWESFIQQDKYLRANRGQYVERNAIFLPMTYRADLSISQDIVRNIWGQGNSLQLRLDIDNVLNLINSDWGVGHRFTTTQPLTSPSADGQGRLQYRLRNVRGQLIEKSFDRTAGPADVYRIMFGVRYNFN